MYESRTQKTKLLLMSLTLKGAVLVMSSLGPVFLHCQLIVLIR